MDAADSGTEGCGRGPAHSFLLLALHTHFIPSGSLGGTTSVCGVWGVLPPPLQFLVTMVWQHRQAFSLPVFPINQSWWFPFWDLQPPSSSSCCLLVFSATGRYLCTCVLCRPIGPLFPGLCRDWSFQFKCTGVGYLNWFESTDRQNNTKKAYKKNTQKQKITQNACK